MGRHARGPARSRVPVAVVVWSAFIVLILVAGPWLADRGRPADSADPLTASAVVVSSLACPNGTGSTLVDVVNPAAPSAGPVRATLAACGYQEGQQLAVQYVAADPARVVLAGATPTAGPGLLPLGVAIAVLLALGAGLAVWIDSRRPPTRHRADGTGRHLVDQEIPDLPADPPAVDPVHRPDGAAKNRTTVGAAGRRQASVDLIFPFSSTLAASLHDELFTHRSVSN